MSFNSFKEKIMKFINKSGGNNLNGNEGSASSSSLR
jgi:hypothetical protein